MCSQSNNASIRRRRKKITSDSKGACNSMASVSYATSSSRLSVPKIIIFASIIIAIQVTLYSTTLISMRFHTHIDHDKTSVDVVNLKNDNIYAGYTVKAPRSTESNNTYQYELSTEENYSLPTPSSPRHGGPYAHLRSTLDYSYHKYYIVQRQTFQDKEIESMLKKVQVYDLVNDVKCSMPKSHPWIVFTAGAMGAGKTHTIKFLADSGRFPLHSFVTVDPDEIRRRLPEYPQYIRNNPETAGEYTRKESGYISEILIKAALEKGKNVLVDGSLRDWEWYHQYFIDLKTEYDRYQIAILHITASREVVFERVKHRSLITGRVVPHQTIEIALKQVPQSVRILSKVVDVCIELNNMRSSARPINSSLNCTDHDKGIQLVANRDSSCVGDSNDENNNSEMTWAKFTKTWLQTCGN